ncbi:MAG: nucleotidyltransferase domain-containing protein [Candidatus Atribacteria bacterium]|nr:nucleotidyltransferase domain-containing protein [Candidatus Atribacteria bacterium]
MRREDILRLLAARRNELMRKFRLRKMGLFGSFARGEENAESDVDIAVAMENPDLFALAWLKAELEEILGRKVDILRFRKNMDELLRRRVEKEILYV